MIYSSNARDRGITLPSDKQPEITDVVASWSSGDRVPELFEELVGVSTTEIGVVVESSALCTGERPAVSNGTCS